MGYNLGGGGGGAAGSIVVGNAVTGGTNNTVLYIDNSGNLGSEAAFGYVASTDTLTVVNHIVSGNLVSGTADGAANSITFPGNGTMVWEGSGVDANEVTVALSANPGADSTVTIPVGTTTLLAGVAIANTWTASQTQSAGTVTVYGANLGSIGASTANTPDTVFFNTQATSNSWHLIEAGDFGSDFNNGLSGTAAATQPTLIVHSATVNATEYNQLNFYGSHGGNVTALTDNVATAFFHTPTLSANGQFYTGNGSYVVRVVDAGGEVQVATGEFIWYAMRGNTGGTVGGIQHVGNDGVLPGLPLIAVSSGTLAITLSATIATNVVTFNMTADTSLTATTFSMNSQANVRFGTAEIIPD